MCSIWWCALLPATYIFTVAYTQWYTGIGFFFLLSIPFSFLTSTITKPPTQNSLVWLLFPLCSRELLQTILWFALMQCSCWEGQYLSSPSNALYSCSRFLLLPLAETACNSLISVFRQRKFILSIPLILKCWGRGETSHYEPLAAV